MDKPLAEAETVTCDMCHKEVPLAEAVMPEYVDYVTYFCGLDCYAQWRRSNQPGVDEKQSS